MTTRLSGRLYLAMTAAAALGLLLAVGVAAVRDAGRAAGDLEQARAELTHARDADSDLASVSASITEARRSLVAADARLRGPAVSAVATLPVVGRSWRAERAVVRAASSVLAGVALTVEAAPALRSGDGIDVRRLSSLGSDLVPAVEAAQRDLRALQDVPTAFTPGRVSSAVDDAVAALQPVVEGLGTGAQAAGLTAGLLGAQGPRHVFVGLQNNAELRGTGGYVSTFATGVVADGRLALEPFRDILDVSDPPARVRRVPAPEEFVEDYGTFLGDTTLWREWTMTPDVPDAASVTAEVAGELLGRKPDVVMLLDVPALSAIVALTGQDVLLPGGETVRPAGLTEALLVDSYAGAGTDVAQQSRRRADLRAAAGSTAAKLLDGAVDPVRGAQELARLARGRHVAIWSATAPEQQRLDALGLSGSADPRGDDLALVSVNNVNANKLDYYVDREVSVAVTLGRDVAEVVQTVVLTNKAPGGLVPYVAGEQTPGTVVNRLEFSLSPRASFRSLRRDGQAATGDVHTGGERTRVHTFVTLPRGGRVEVVLRYDVPLDDRTYRLRLLPQALAKDAALSVVLRPEDGVELRGLVGVKSVGRDATRSGPWTEQEVVAVTVGAPDVGMWSRLRPRLPGPW